MLQRGCFSSPAVCIALCKRFLIATTAPVWCNSMGATARFSVVTRDCHAFVQQWLCRELLVEAAPYFGVDSVSGHHSWAMQLIALQCCAFITRTVACPSCVLAASVSGKVANCLNLNLKTSSAAYLVIGPCRTEQRLAEVAGTARYCPGALLARLSFLGHRLFMPSHRPLLVRLTDAWRLPQS